MIKKNKNILFLTGFSSFAMIIYSILFLYIPVFLKYTLSFSGTEIGILLGTGSIITIFTAFPTGMLSDRFKAKNLAAVSLLFAGLFFAGLTVFKSFSVLFLLFILIGVSETMIKLATDAILLKTVNRKSFGLNFGFYTFIKLAVWGISMVIGGYAILLLDFYLFFKIVFVFIFILILASFLLPKTKTACFSAIQYKKDILTPYVLFFFLVMSLFGMHFGAEKTSLGLFLMENLKLNKINMGIYMAGENIVLGITAYITGTKIDKGMSAKKLLYIGLFLSGLFHILMASQTDIYLSFLFRAIHGIGDGIILVLMYVGITKLFVKGRYGGNNSLLTLSITIGVFIGSLIYGPLGEKLGYEWPLIISGIATLGILGVAYSYKELLHH